MEDTLQNFSLFFNYALPLIILMIAYFIGSTIEKRHFANIRKREEAIHGFPVVSFNTMPEDWNASSANLVTGSIVISLDYFKRVIAGLRGLVGGRI
jgi:hypothetical protein